VFINDIITGQLWAREDTKESSHEPFQALWRPLHKRTDESHANLQQTWHYFRSKFVLGPSLKRPIFSNYLHDDGSGG